MRLLFLVFLLCPQPSLCVPSEDVLNKATSGSLSHKDEEDGGVASSFLPPVSSPPEVEDEDELEDARLLYHMMLSVRQWERRKKEKER